MHANTAWMYGHVGHCVLIDHRTRHVNNVRFPTESLVAARAVAVLARRVKILQYLVVSYARLYPRTVRGFDQDSEHLSYKR